MKKINSFLSGKRNLAVRTSSVLLICCILAILTFTIFGCGTKSDPVSESTEISSATASEATSNNASPDSATSDEATPSQTKRSTDNRHVQKAKLLDLKIIKTDSSGNIKVETADISKKGFSYTSDDGWSVKMDGLCIYGEFSYVNKLTDEDLETWGHGGRLFDSYNNFVENEELVFWSDYESEKFSAKIPERLPAGNYYLELYQKTNNYISGSILIDFSIS